MTDKANRQQPKTNPANPTELPKAGDMLSDWLRIMRRTAPHNAAPLKTFFPAVDKVGDLFVFNIGDHRLHLTATVN